MSRAVVPSRGSPAATFTMNCRYPHRNESSPYDNALDRNLIALGRLLILKDLDRMPVLIDSPAEQTEVEKSIANQSANSQLATPQ